jgi:hypothetical protein
MDGTFDDQIHLRCGTLHCAAYSFRTLMMLYFLSTISAKTKWLMQDADVVDLDGGEVTEAAAVVDPAGEVVKMKRKSGECTYDPDYTSP